MNSLSYTSSYKKHIFGLFLFVVSSLYAYASTPYVTILPSGNGNDVDVAIINADPNAPVIFYYTSTRVIGTQTQKIGTTDQTGSFGGSVSTNAYSISSDGPVYVTINGSQSSTISWPYTATSTSLALSIDQPNPTVAQGQSIVVGLLGGTGSYYLSNNSDSNVAQVNLLGKNLSVYGLSPGKTSVQVCSLNGGCITPTITVTDTVSQTLSPVSIRVPVSVGKMITLPLSGGTGVYTLSSQNPPTFNAAISGDRLFVTGLLPGENNVTVCSGASVCGSIKILVSLATSSLPQTKQEVSEPSKEKYLFNNPLYFGMESDEVLELQKRLVAEGYFNVTPNGYFGKATRQAVKDYQKDRNLTPFGNVGPATRDELNK
jgi:hypothetical protein